jgi:prepilin-type N-terminal cleavage/methylation domain-containing protein
MRQTVLSNKKGFSIIELLIAMVILFIGMTSMLDALGRYLQINLDNAIRNEAMRIAQEQMIGFRNVSFATIQPAGTGANDYPLVTVARNFRKFSQNFNVNRRIQRISANSVYAQIHVTWQTRGINHQHSIASLLSVDD